MIPVAPEYLRNLNSKIVSPYMGNTKQVTPFWGKGGPERIQTPDLLSAKMNGIVYIFLCLIMAGIDSIESTYSIACCTRCTLIYLEVFTPELFSYIWGYKW
jgi:hypothetical protein